MYLLFLLYLCNSLLHNHLQHWICGAESMLELSITGVVPHGVTHIMTLATAIYWLELIKTGLNWL